MLVIGKIFSVFNDICKPSVQGPQVVWHILVQRTLQLSLHIQMDYSSSNFVQV